jgi:hypothetical protein
MDNHHVYISESQASCGILELSKLGSDPEKILYALASRLYHPSRGSPAAFVIWSDTIESNGVKLSLSVSALFGGQVLETSWVENPKTSNNIRVWIWEIPHVEFKKWYKEYKIKKIKAE